MHNKVTSGNDRTQPGFMRDPRMAGAGEIEDNLKRIYASSPADDIPDRFVKLLAALREKERGS